MYTLNIKTKDDPKNESKCKYEELSYLMTKLQIYLLSTDEEILSITIKKWQK